MLKICHNEQNLYISATNKKTIDGTNKRLKNVYC